MKYAKKSSSHLPFFFSSLLLVLLCLTPAYAHADVELTFYSHDYSSEFPHTFIQARGTLENGIIINEDFGFTSKHISPRILMGSVEGIIKAPPADYKAGSDPQFKIVVSDSVYQLIVKHRIEWQSGKKRNYNLNNRNCVHYVAEVLKLTGLIINSNSSNLKKPKSFLHEVLSLNPDLISYHDDITASQMAISPKLED